MIDRRRLLALLGATGLATITGCTPGGSADDPDVGSDRPYCVPSGDLTRYTALAELPLVYEVSQRRTALRIESGFAGQLSAWLQRVRSAGTDLDQVWNYGAWIDGGRSCDSWHHAGRAFDLSRLRVRGGRFLSCRYDRWSTSSGAALDRARRDYWAIAAGLHHDFAYVLTYLYDANHHNHIHIDNGVSGGGPSTFRTRSRVQVQAVQAICSYLWDRPVEITGRWDGATRGAVGAVLDQLGVADDLTRAESWAAFTQASSTRFAS